MSQNRSFEAAVNAILFGNRINRASRKGLEVLKQQTYNHSSDMFADNDPSGSGHSLAEGKDFKAMQNEVVSQQKNTFETKGTVTCVAVVKDFIAWGTGIQVSKCMIEFGVSIWKCSNLKYTKAQQFETDSLIRGLQFSNSETCLQLVCANLNGFIHLYEEINGNFEFVIKHQVCELQLTSISFRPGYVIAGSNSSAFLYHFEVVQNSNGEKSFVTLATKKILCSGTILDLSFVHLEEGKIEAILADTSGKIIVFRVERNWDLNITYTGLFNLSVEQGYMLSCSNDGNFVAIACGDRKVRVLKRMVYQDVSSLNTVGPQLSGMPHDSWEVAESIEVGQPLTAVGMSGNGLRIAVGTEENNAEVFDVAGGCKLNSFPSAGRIRSVCLDNIGSYILFGGFDRKVFHCSLDSGFDESYAITKDNTNKIQSVSLDAEGKFLATGCFQPGEVTVYNLSNGEKKEIEITNKAKIYVVKLSPDGRCLVYGTYKNETVVLDIKDLQNPKEIIRKSFNHFIWGLDVIQTTDQRIPYRLAIGSWDSTVTVFDFGVEGNEKVVAIIEEEDRVFDVCLSDDGKFLAVANRNKYAKVYLIEGRVKEVLRATSLERVYCVAISPKGTLFAFGGISKDIVVFQLPHNIIQKYTRNNTVHRMEFMDERTLVAISEEGTCVVYNVNSPDPVLQLRYNECGNSVAINSAGMLATAHGHRVTVYGKGDGSFGPMDQPSFDLAMKLMQDPQSFKIAFKAQPTLVNTVGHNQNTLMHIAVETENFKALDMLLSSVIPVGLLMNSEGMTPLMLAAQKNLKGFASAILDAIAEGEVMNTSQMFATLFAPMPQMKANKVCTQDVETNQISSSSTLLLKKNQNLSKKVQQGPLPVKSISLLEVIGEKFPDILLGFFKRLKLQRCDSSVLGGIKYMRLQAPLYVGLPCKSPQGFWQEYHEKFEKEEEAFSRSLIPCKVKAYCIPIPGIAGEWQKDGTRPAGFMVKSFMGAIVDASRRLQDFTAFEEGTVLYSLVMLKWQTLKPYFFYQFYLFLFYLALCCGLSWGLSQFKFATEDEFWSSKWGYVLGGLSILLAVRSLLYLRDELSQYFSKYCFLEQGHTDRKHGYLWVSALIAYFCEDSWNVLDCAAFTSQLITDVLVFFRPSCLIGFASVSVLLLFFKILFFLRGSQRWGPFVHMIQRTVQSMWAFLLVMLVFFLGFAFAFAILLEGEEGFEDVHSSFFTVTLIIFGEYGSILKVMNGWNLSAFMFEALMLICVVIMLNLLIAIMTDGHESVKQNSEVEFVFDLASIISELEQVHAQDMRMDAHGHHLHALFPRWVHILKPIESVRSAQDTKISKSNEELMNTLRDMVKEAVSEELNR